MLTLNDNDEVLSSYTGSNPVLTTNFKTEKMELNWDNANDWQDKANAKKEIFDEPKWSWDCNFKLDFDGSLVRVISRFYPPHKTSSNCWEGTVTVKLLNTELLKKEFKCDNLDELKTEVEKSIKRYAGSMKARLS